MFTSEFYGLDQEVLLRALQVLESQKKAEIISFDDNQGVKFFWTTIISISCNLEISQTEKMTRWGTA